MKQPRCHNASTPAGPRPPAPPSENTPILSRLITTARAACCPRTTPALRLFACAVILGTALLSPQAPGQPPVPPPAPTPAQPNRAISAALASGQAPGPEVVAPAFQRIRAALDAWLIPQPAADAATPWPAVTAAAVQLRLDGRLMGSAAAQSTGPEALPREALLASVTAAAMREAERRLAVPRDALRDEALRAAGERLTLSLELAGPPTPLEPVEFDDLDRLVDGGLEGLALEGSERSAVMFPASMMALGLTPSAAGRSLAARVLGGAELAFEDLSKAGAGRGLKWTKFRVSHAAQSEPRGRMISLHRGDRVASLSGLNAAGLRTLADEIAAHLSTRAERDPTDESGASLASYDAATDRRGRAAPAGEAALVALALARHAASAPDGDRSRRAAALVLTRLAADDAESRRAASDPLAAGLIAMALAELGPPREPSAALASLRDRVASALAGSFDTERGFAEGITGPARAAVAAGLVACARSGLGGIDVTLASAAVRRAFAELRPGELVGMMPLLGWAEIDLAELTRADTLPAAAALRQMRAQLWQNQLGPVPPGDDREDLIGGVLFADGARIPTWQGLRPMAFAATALRDPRLTPADTRAAETVRLLYAARFIRQLQAGPVTGGGGGGGGVGGGVGGWLYPAPASAAGGLRAAPGVHEQPAGASAMGLLLLTELSRSLDASNPQKTTEK
jgi:hypothetical protein